MSTNATDATGSNLRERRRAAGLTQQRLAELARCSIHSVRLFETGYSPASSAVLGRLVRILDGDSLPNEHDPPGWAGRVETAGSGDGRDGL
jgi:transcriptional regulator with XRE-family HTH domain